jgi:hypothetical protein
MKGESSRSSEVRLSVAGRRAVAGAVGASLSLPLAASAFAAPVCACGGGGSADAGTDSIPAPEEPAASSSQPDAPPPPAHNPSPPREEASGQSVHLDAPSVDEVAPFVLWLRKQVPPEQPLLFYDQGFNSQVALSGDESLTESDLVERFESSAV